LFEDPLNTEEAATVAVVSGFLIPCSFCRNFWNNLEPLILSKLLEEGGITVEVFVGLTAAGWTPS